MRAGRKRIVVLRLRHVAIALAIGFVLNIALAWRSAYMWASVPPIWNIETIETSASWPIRMADDIDLVSSPEFSRGVRAWRLLGHIEHESYSARDRASGEEFDLDVRRDGWPWVALERRELVIWKPVPVKFNPDVFQIRELYRGPRRQSREGSFEFRGRRLPYLPVWPGFAGNTVVFALVAFPLVVLPGTIIRMRRAVRGRCTACAYDITGLATCPECGAAPSSA